MIRLPERYAYIRHTHRRHCIVCRCCGLAVRWADWYMSNGKGYSFHVDCWYKVVNG